MRHPLCSGLLAALILAAVSGVHAQPPCSAGACPCFLQRIGPAGGWHPYGGGLLGWWDRRCFPRYGGPDDYCRKGLPAACWPVCQPNYAGGPIGIGPPPENSVVRPPTGELRP